MIMGCTNTRSWTPNVDDETERAHKVLAVATSILRPFAASAVRHPWARHPDRVRYERLGGYDGLGVLVRLATLSASTRKLLSGAPADVENERAQGQFAATYPLRSDAIGGFRLAGNLLTVDLLTTSASADEGSWPAHVEFSAVAAASAAAKPDACAAAQPVVSQPAAAHGPLSPPIGFGASGLIDAAIAQVCGACGSVAWLGLTQREVWLASCMAWLWRGMAWCGVAWLGLV